MCATTWRLLAADCRPWSPAVLEAGSLESAVWRLSAGCGLDVVAGCGKG